MTKHSKIIGLIREKVRNQEYEFTIPHFFEEMTNDDLLFSDIEAAISSGGINRVFSDDLRGARYEIVGRATDNRLIAVICRIGDLSNKRNRQAAFHRHLGNL